MTVRRGVITSQVLRPSPKGKIFLVADSPPHCFRDRWGDWHCGHNHDADERPLLELQDAYHWMEGWTAQQGAWAAL